MGSERTENCDHACDGQATCVTGRCDKDAMFANRDATLTPEPLAHILYDNEDEHRPMQICDANGQVVLSLCKICGLGEAELLDAPCIETFATNSNGPTLWACLRGGSWISVSKRTFEQLMARGKTLQRGDLNWVPQAVDRARRAEKPGHDVPITFIDGEPNEMPDAPPTRGETPPYRPPPGTTISAADILEEAGDTFRTRNAAYGSNYKMVGKIMATLFPEGVPVELLGADQFHLVELIVVKLSRYAISGLTHIDSARDGAVYFAMCEMVNRNKENKQ